MKKIFTIRGAVITIALSLVLTAASAVMYGKVLRSEVTELGTDDYYTRAPNKEPEWLTVNRSKRGCIYPRQEHSLW